MILKNDLQKMQSNQLPLNNFLLFKGGISMEHLLVGLFVVSIIIISIHYKIVKVNLNLLSKNVGNIVTWIACIMLGSIISTWLR